MYRQSRIHGKLLTIGLAVLALTAAYKVQAIESPSYQVALQQDAIEFRRYESFVIAETLISGADNYNAAANEGFRRLFDYISGDNTTTEKIEMTAPVQQIPVSRKITMTAPVQQLQTSEGWKVSFVLPSIYTLQNAPDPTDTRIVIREIPPRLMAAVQYSGRWTKKNLERHTEELIDGLAEMNIGHSNDIQSAVYNAPFSLPFLRRNEVLVPVEELPISAITDKE